MKISKAADNPVRPLWVVNLLANQASDNSAAKRPSQNPEKNS
jgi:hypothetical protein